MEAKEHLRNVFLNAYDKEYLDDTKNTYAHKSFKTKVKNLRMRTEGRASVSVPMNTTP